MTYYLVTLKYLPMPKLPEKTLIITAHDEEQAKYKATKTACREWDLYPSAMPLIEIISILRTGH